MDPLTPQTGRQLRPVAGGHCHPQAALGPTRGLWTCLQGFLGIGPKVPGPQVSATRVLVHPDSPALPPCVWWRQKCPQGTSPPTPGCTRPGLRAREQADEALTGGGGPQGQGHGSNPAPPVPGLGATPPSTSAPAPPLRKATRVRKGGTVSLVPRPRQWPGLREGGHPMHRWCPQSNRNPRARDVSRARPVREAAPRRSLEGQDGAAARTQRRLIRDYGKLSKQFISQ